jgi:hypothetical protein
MSTYQMDFKRDYLRMAFLTFITVIAWIVFDVYKSYTRHEMPEVLERQIAPLDPTLDVEFIKTLDEKVSLEALQSGQRIREEETKMKDNLFKTTQQTTDSGMLTI